MIKGIALTQDEVKKGFDQTEGRCVDLQGKVSEKSTEQGKKTAAECEIICENDPVCSAFQHTTKDNSCTTYSDTTPLTGNLSAIGEYSCYFKLNEDRQIYQKQTGACKIPAATAEEKARESENQTPMPEAKSAAECQRACEEHLMKCWAF